MLPSAASLDAAAVPVTPRELSVGPQRRRNVTGLPVLQLVAVPRVRVTAGVGAGRHVDPCLLYTSPSPRDKRQSRMPSSA